MFDDAWQNVLESIKRDMQPAVFETWFKGIKLLDTSNGAVVIGVPTVFYLRQMEARYYKLISEKLKEFDIEHKSLSFVVDADSKPKVRRAREVVSRDESQRPVELRSAAKKAVSSLSNDNDDTGLNPRYRFDNFIVGTNNDAAMSAAQYVVEHPGEKYNPYYLYGGSGLGKTHLIQAIGNEILKQNPKAKVRYLTTEQFYSSYVTAMRNKITGFGAEYRKLDVLIIDDIQMITGKDKSQDEFFNIFNELYMKGKQIIVSSDRLPGQIATLDARLSTRLLSGVPIDIQMPDFETRCAILAAKAEWDGVEISQQAIEYIANNIRTNIRELEGKLNQLVVFSEVRGLSIDEIINDGYLVDTGFGGARNITPKKIIDQVAAYYQISADEMRSSSRAQIVAAPRHVAAYLLCEELNLSTPKIAVELGRKDHTTAMASIRKIRKDLKLNFQLREDINILKNKIFAEN